MTRRLLQLEIRSPKDFEWVCQMRFYFDARELSVMKQLRVEMANAKFFYGFEYLGVQDRLVQTPLTDRCYLTMTQALEAKLGGSPFGIFISFFSSLFSLSVFFCIFFFIKNVA